MPAEQVASLDMPIHLPRERARPTDRGQASGRFDQSMISCALNEMPRVCGVAFEILRMSPQVCL